MTDMEKRLLWIAMIERLQFMVLVNSVIYYRLNNNILSDHEFDTLSKSAAKHSAEKHSRWHYVMFDHDGNSGTEALLGRLHHADWVYLNEMAQLILSKKPEEAWEF